MKTTEVGLRFTAVGTTEQSPSPGQLQSPPWKQHQPPAPATGSAGMPYCLYICWVSLFLRLSVKMCGGRTSVLKLRFSTESCLYPECPLSALSPQLPDPYAVTRQARPSEWSPAALPPKMPDLPPLWSRPVRGA